MGSQGRKRKTTDDDKGKEVNILGTYFVRFPLT